jgi:hypothetical protein
MSNLDDDAEVRSLATKLVQLIFPEAWGCVRRRGGGGGGGQFTALRVEESVELLRWFCLRAIGWRWRGIESWGAKEVKSTGFRQVVVPTTYELHSRSGHGAVSLDFGFNINSFRAVKCHTQPEPPKRFYFLLFLLFSPSFSASFTRSLFPFPFFPSMLSSIRTRRERSQRRGTEKWEGRKGEGEKEERREKRGEIKK